VLNGKEVHIIADPLKRLLDVLREDFVLTGPKEGCGEGECGACSVLMDGRLVNSCLAAVGTVEGKRITTIEGLRGTKRFAVLEKAFTDAGAVQCGFCTPGMIMAAHALLSANPAPNEDEIKEAISGNLCRCTGYGMVETFMPAALKEALEFRAGHKSIPLAGGTDLMVKRKSWAGTLPKFDKPVLMISGLSELKGCTSENGALRIGAAETLADTAANELVSEVLRLAVKQMASPGIRNMGTLGGNICNASPAGDTLPALYALDATVTLQSISGSRELPIAQFITGPGRTELKDGELMTMINIPLTEFSNVYYRKVGTRKADALSKLSFAGLADIKEGHIGDVRIAFGAVAPTAVRSAGAEKLLKGIELIDLPDLMPQIKDIYSRFIRPIDDQRSSAAYRKEVCMKLLEDFLLGLKRS
jgi:xanthine dehydrogenase iron-sulfur cluster and FAD-binding subunit A